MRKMICSLLLAGAVTVAGCGVPVQPAPVAVPDAALPKEAQETTADVVPRETHVEVYLVESNRLVRVDRSVGTITVESALRKLFQGPTAVEADAGIRSAVAPAVDLVNVDVTERTATIEVSKPFFDVTGEEQILAIAQTVFTVTAIAGIDAVQLVVDGQRTEIPRGDGTLTPEPVSRPDYAALAPPS